MSISLKASLSKVIWAGIIAGLVSAATKSGVEGILPARTPDTVPPPVLLLNLLGLHPENWFYTWNEVKVSWGGALVHYLFSVGAALFYIICAQIWPKARACAGIIFGLILAVLGFHIIVLPILGLEEPFWEWSLDSLLSELVGSAVWAYTIEVIRSRILDDNK